MIEHAKMLHVALAKKTRVDNTKTVTGFFDT